MSSISTLVKQLKENNEDFEFYPTNPEMLLPIFEKLPVKVDSILDIGCGTCNFRKYFDTYSKMRQVASEKEEERKELDAERNGERYYRRSISKHTIEEYYVIEKSKTLINTLDKDIIVLGTDFNQSLLIDKSVDVIFCNPPYSEYETWTTRIIKEGNCDTIYLIIPQRWQENENIQRAIKSRDAVVTVLGSFDFLNAERSARAKVDVLEIKKNVNASRYGGRSEIDDSAFDEWFDSTFKMREKEDDRCSAYEREQREKQRIKNQISTSDSKAKILVELYNQEMNALFESFKAVCQLDSETLTIFGLSKSSIKSALKQKTKSLKIIYWQMVFEELEEITSRLTSKTRESMLGRFKKLTAVDFTIENIYPLIIWVIKNANSYYNDQLIDFYKTLSDPDNVKPYKSNQKVFESDGWRHASRYERKQSMTHYTLDYRIICDIFGKTYFGHLDSHKNTQVIDDICTIANNLGFEPIWPNHREYPTEFGKKYQVMCKNKKDGVLFDYRIYKNGNTHVRFNVEFAKAMNVEVSRLLGWIRSAEDIKREFTPEMAKGAEKYFKVNNCISLAGNGLKLLTAS